MQIFTDLAAHPSFAEQEVREQLVSFSLQAVQAKELPDELKLEIALLAISEMKKHVARYPDDARERLQLALAYRTVGNIDENLKEIDAALALSPKKQQILLQKGLTQLELGRFVDASNTLDEAYALGPGFADLAKYAALGRFAAGNIAGGNEILSLYPGVAAEVEAIIKQLSTRPTQ